MAIAISRLHRQASVNQAPFTEEAQTMKVNTSTKERKRREASNAYVPITPHPTLICLLSSTT
jgi:hypothetical protein